MNIPQDPGRDSGSNDSRRQPVRAVTLHRTTGHWPGDYSVGKNRVHGSPGTFNYLVGEDEGQWVQFYPDNVRCSHAAGANRAGPGIEFSGEDNTPLTDWQIRAGGEIIRHEHDTYGVPYDFYDGPTDIAVDGSNFTGYISHEWVATEPKYRHVDNVTRDEFNRMSGGAPQEDEDSMFPIYILVAGKKQGWVVGDGTGYAWVDQPMMDFYRAARQHFGLKSYEVMITNPDIAETIAERAGKKPGPTP